MKKKKKQRGGTLSEIIARTDSHTIQRTLVWAGSGTRAGQPDRSEETPAAASQPEHGADVRLRFAKSHPLELDRSTIEFLPGLLDLDWHVDRVTATNWARLLVLAAAGIDLRTREGSKALKARELDDEFAVPIWLDGGRRDEETWTDYYRFVDLAHPRVAAVVMPFVWMCIREIGIDDPSLAVRIVYDFWLGMFRGIRCSDSKQFNPVFAVREHKTWANVARGFLDRYRAKLRGYRNGIISTRSGRVF